MGMETGGKLREPAKGQASGAKPLSPWANFVKVEMAEASRSTLVFIAIGANLPGLDGRAPIDTCRRAVACLDLLPELRLRGLSRWYLSAPVPPAGQPDYVNAVAALLVDPGVSIDPATLLARVMAIETKCGRRRGEANAARTLDLDIIGIGAMVRSGPDPVVPHPRAHGRAFVLAPLADVAPDWVHPVLRLTAAALLAKLPPQVIRAI